MDRSVTTTTSRAGRAGSDSEHAETQNKSRSTRSERNSDVLPDQTPDVRVLLYCFKPPSPRAAAAPPPRQAVVAFGSREHQTSQDPYPTVWLLHLRATPRCRKHREVNQSLIEDPLDAPRPAAERPAFDIVGCCRGVSSQPSRGRCASLRLPLTAACCGVKCLAQYGTYGAPTVAVRP